jgi:hypothetical protein
MPWHLDKAFHKGILIGSEGYHRTHEVRAYEGYEAYAELETLTMSHGLCVIGELTRRARMKRLGDTLVTATPLM